MIGEIRKKKGLGEDLINLTSCKSLDLTSVKYGEGDDQNIRKKTIKLLEKNVTYSVTSLKMCY